MIRRISYGLWVGVAAVLVVTALLMTAARALLPQVSEYRDQLVTLLAQQLDLPLEVEAVEARWHGLGPRLAFRGLTLKDRSGTLDLLHLEQAVVDIDVPRSLWRGSPQIARLMLAGMRLSVTRHADGRVTVLGLERQGPPVKLEDLIRWLGERRRITIRDSALDWHDELRGLPVQHLRDIRFRLRSSGLRHQLEGHALLAGRISQPFSFALDLQGRLDRSGAWDAGFYLETRDLDLGKLPWDLQMADLHLKEGRASLRLWVRWRRARLQQLAGRLGLDDLQLQRLAGKGQSVAALKLEHLGGDFLLARQGGDWQLAMQGLQLGMAGRRWPESDLQLAVGGTRETPRLTARFGYLDLDTVRHLLQLAPALPGETPALLAAIRPAGQLRDAYVYYEGGQEPRFVVATRFEGLQTAPWHAFPGLGGMQGRLLINQEGGLLELDARNARLDYGKLFRAPLVMTRLAGKCYWLRSGTGWQVRGRGFGLGNDDLHLDNDFDLATGGDQPPRLDLEGRFSVARLASLGRYLPATVMRPGLVRWLERAIVAGRVPAGTLSFHGPMISSPFAAGAVLEARFNVLDGVLDYAPGWPRIEEIEAGLLFHNSRLDVTMAAGESLSSTLQEARISIPDMGELPARLAVEGRADGPVGDVLRFLRETPLRKRFAARVAELEATGRSRLQLSLHRLLAPGQPVEVSGTLSLDDDILRVGGRQSLEISGLRGDLHFGPAGVSAEALAGRMLGMDSRFTVATREEGGDRVTVIGATGRIDDATVRALLPLPMFRYLGGASDWQATLTLWPPRENVAAAGALVIWSDLRGMAIALPEPVFKTAAERRELTLRTRLPRSLDPPVELQLGSLLSAVLDLDPQLHLERGEILFGEGEPRLPPHGGLRLRGSLQDFSYSAWTPYLEEATGGGSSLLRSLDVKLDHLEAVDRDFHQVHLKGRLEDEVWAFDARSRELQGYIEYPLTPALPVIMELDSLQVTPRPDAGEPTDPRDLPPLIVHSKRFRYDQIDFDALELRTSPQPTGMRIDKLSLNAPQLHIEAHGDWLTVGGGGQKSIFDIALDSKDLGKALTMLGFEGNIKGGRTHMKLVGHWAGEPAAIAMERLSGTLSMEIKDGRLLAVEPGAGRIFGLVSLQALPRRLSLDFSDIFDKGFGFDKISGTFAIREGIATTRDLIMEGPAARIEAKGRIDLVNKRYDQIVTVIPHVTSGLPVAGAVAGGIGVGAAILLAEQMFKQEIEKATRVKYRVTGPWNDPRVERLQEEGQEK